MACGGPGTALEGKLQYYCATLPRVGPPKPYPSSLRSSSTSRQTCDCWGGLTAIEDFGGGCSEVSKPRLGQVFSRGKPVAEPVSFPQGRLVGCSCGRCSWAGWLALVLWKPRAPAAWECWANAQPWHGPLLLTLPVQVPVTDAGNICCELIRSSPAAEDRPLPLSAPVTFTFRLSQCQKKNSGFPSSSSVLTLCPLGAPHPSTHPCLSWAH